MELLPEIVVSARAANVNEYIKVNVAVYKDLNIEFVTKNVFVTRTQCKNAIKPL